LTEGFTVGFEVEQLLIEIVIGIASLMLLVVAFAPTVAVPTPPIETHIEASNVTFAPKPQTQEL
jgi:hypothetical protein